MLRALETRLLCRSLKARINILLLLKRPRLSISLSRNVSAKGFLMGCNCSWTCENKKGLSTIQIVIIIELRLNLDVRTLIITLKTNLESGPRFAEV